MCKQESLFLVIDLGMHPHSDFFPTEAQLYNAEITFPLRLMSCGRCGLLQIDYFVDPEILYQTDYLYQSSTTATGRAHYATMAESIVRRFSIPPGSLVVDIGSNVGVLLAGFKEVGMRVLGVDPAQNIAEKSIAGGIDTIVDFFGSALAKAITVSHGKAQVITATNVFAHLHEIDDSVLGMKELLADEGVIVIEAPHALPLIENVEYDTIYHQHISYLSVKPMRSYFESMGLELFDVEKNLIHGGSLRFFVGHPGRHELSSTVDSLINEEELAGLYSVEKLAQFADRVRGQKEALLSLVLSLKKQGKSIVALSAPAKGNTLLNYCHLDASFLNYATEKNPLKVGRYTPGVHLPIYPDEKIIEDVPDFCLLLAWNFADEIMKNMTTYREKGGRFIIPIPYPRIYGETNS
ncbi:class I SAM-dependent methyltransferase [Patescibacteria group bacterium]|nr:class I SAM-dependent methyltransferase [Patescibacteria group bacterium]